MTKRFLTYHAGPQDPKETQSADLKFTDGVEVEVPEGRDWLWQKLSQNPWFSSRVEEGAAEPQPADHGFNKDVPKRLDFDAELEAELLKGLEPPRNAEGSDGGPLPEPTHASDPNKIN